MTAVATLLASLAAFGAWRVTGEPVVAVAAAVLMFLLVIKLSDVRTRQRKNSRARQIHDELMR